MSKLMDKIDAYLPGDEPWPWHKHVVVLVVLGSMGVGFVYLCYLISIGLDQL